MAANSSELNTLPVGLWGVLSRISRVLGPTASSRSASSNE